MTRRLTDLQLERYLAQALPPADHETVQRTLTESPDDQAALRELEASTAALMTSLPPAAFIARVSPAKKPRFSWWYGLLGAAVAAGLGAVVLNRPPVEDEVMTKGGHAWRITVVHGSKGLTATPDRPLHPDDQLVFELTSSRQAFAAVISHAPDGFQVYSPRDQPVAEQVSRGLSVLHDGAELDDTLGREVVYLLYSTQRFDVDAARRALEADPDLTRWNDVEIERRDFVKEK
jgi:hypothetical protein